ncbi:tetratricopeptide repeat protein [Porphyromonas circumdentaria]|uniref:Uncharacterized protein n=1 Tax=Porphyromonas circumdentaria TaxID=29524 RepID=A0A1T4PQP8_9PORP|nr:hypothetical protein [Porphyromonas circumdentaria]MBB6276455.1 tetratricopeptide (TPR) repeat protein [Porphyromonas circumdentaria]MDO4722939.1 hypothetical protein [Porphyromonas circumdentaria]SJZ93739.1 hypothetical protein SAMN02745171_01549 [Porphyromonas circumdentaria]
MRLKRYTLTSLLALFALLPLFSTPHKELIYQAYISGNMDAWYAVLNSMNAKANKTFGEELELLNYEYGYIGWCMSKKKKKMAREYIDRFDARLERLQREGKSLAVLSAYKSASYGFQIGLNRAKAPFLGQKSIAAAERSVKLDPKNWLGFVQLGNIDFYKPAIFGGSKKDALTAYLKAEKVFVNSGLEKDWNLLSLWAQIALTYEALEDTKRAEAYYLKILKAEPNFKWVRDELYVNFKKNNNLR